MSVAAIVVAAGRGTRAGGPLPKQFRALGGESVLARALRVFLSHGGIGRVQPVIHADDRDLFQTTFGEIGRGAGARLLAPVVGGATRQESVRMGLEALAATTVPPGLVLIHDAARPFASAALVDRAMAAARRHGAAAPGTAVTDTIKVVSADGAVATTPPRESLRAIQTPQAFAFDRILEAHRRAAEAGVHGMTDDAAVAEWAGLEVTVFEGDPANVKLTHPADFADGERRLGRGGLWVTRVGTGFDVHAFAPGDHLWLGGVRVPHDRGVTAHSDGDVVLHALTDAMLGALCDGDIGVHFPPSDARWRGASSDRFLAFAAERVHERGGLVDHLDVTVLCEAPRIGPLREQMRQCIATIAGIDLSSVSVKATTTERLGFLGRREGIAAQASATIRLPLGAE